MAEKKPAQKEAKKPTPKKNDAQKTIVKACDGYWSTVAYEDSVKQKGPFETKKDAEKALDALLK